MNRSRPTFLIIGAYKAGTTSLHHYLSQHPQIFMSRIKEIRFLTYAGHLQRPLTPLENSALTWPIRSLANYEALFTAGIDVLERGDISPCYLAFPHQSILGIQECTPEAKIIAVLRHPVDRAYSSYVGLVRSGREEVLDFRRALTYEQENRPRKGDHGQRRNFMESLYSDALALYYAQFPRDQIRVFLYDDLCADATGLLKQIFAFIGVDEGFAPDTSTRHNTSAWPRQRLLRDLWLPGERLIYRIARKASRITHRDCVQPVDRLLRVPAPPLDQELRHELLIRYREDILRTQALIDRDLSHWLT
ncbi:MAG: sulfotransferase [Caldilineaceae bacterium]|nr:sulfotransferase [Caldilineaceae bacterium]